MSISNPSEQQPGLFGKIGLFFLRRKLRAVAKASHGYKKEEVDFIKRHPDLALDVLIEDLGNKSQDRMHIPPLLGIIGGRKAEDACLKLLLDPNEYGPVRGVAVQAVATMKLAAKSPFFEALVSCVHEVGGYVEHPAAMLLCKTGRREALSHVCAYWLACSERLLRDVENALDGMDTKWTESKEAAALVPALIDAFSNGDEKKRMIVVRQMGKLGAVEFAELLHDAMAGPASYYAERALRGIAQKHKLKPYLDQFDLMERQKEEKRRQAEERKLAEQAEVRASLARMRASDGSSIQPGQYFEARGVNVLLIYGECLERMGSNIIYAKCYSRMCPGGESGTSRIDRIIRVIDKDEFESAISHLR